MAKIQYWEITKLLLGSLKVPKFKTDGKFVAFDNYARFIITRKNITYGKNYPMHL